MADETNQAADGLRDVPSDIVEYEKFVAEGGPEHNDKLVNRDKAIADAKAAGVLPDNPEEQAEEKKHRNSFQQRVTRLQRKIGERDQRIRDLEAQVSTTAGKAAAPAPAPANGTRGTRETQQPAAPAAAPAGTEKQHVNGKAPQTEQTPPRPKEDDFKTYGEFIEALTDWKTDRKLEAADEKKQQAQAERAEADKGKTITDAHNARVDEAKTRYPDWDAAFKGLNDNSFTEPMVVFIFESDHGPDVTYYLGRHRDELARIAALSPIRQASELGKIEAKIQAEIVVEKKEPGEEEDEQEELPPAAARPPAEKRTNVTKAPPPAKPIGGTSGKGTDEMPDPSDFVAYEAWSRRQAAKKK
jgi:hypothetical protein